MFAPAILRIDMKFEWDTKKEQKNIRKHGVSFEQACYVFADPFALSLPDTEHSEQEERWIMLGKSLNQTLLVVVHTYRDSENNEVVRIISARKAATTEQATYLERCPK